MSLIYDALRQGERVEAAPHSGAPSSSPLASEPAPSAWAGVVVFTAILLMGGGGMAWWYVARTQVIAPPPHAAAVEPRAVAAGAAASPSTSETAQVSVSQESSAMLPLEAGTAAPQPISGQTFAAPPVPPPAVVRSAELRAATSREAASLAPITGAATVRHAVAPPRPLQSPASVARSAIRSRPAARTIPISPPSELEQTESARTALPTDRQFEQFLEAMRANNLAAASAHLSNLRNQLGRTSVTLLRAESWFALASGDLPSARRGYSELLERLPGDEEAAINLASVELRGGRVEAARGIVAGALRGNPESEALKTAMARFREPRP